MPGPQRRRKMHTGDTHLKKRWRLRCRTKDLDQIDEDLQKKNAARLLNQPLDLETPGMAQFYCVHCSRNFIDQTAMEDHFRTKVHKRRLKALEDEPYSVEESERAGGMGSYLASKKRCMETLRRDAPPAVTPCGDVATDVEQTMNSSPPSVERQPAG